jgi:hypothetical protein
MVPQILETDAVSPENGNHDRPQGRREVPVATFYDSITFNWDEDEFEAVEAAEHYCKTAWPAR